MHPDKWQEHWTCPRLYSKIEKNTKSCTCGGSWNGHKLPAMLPKRPDLPVILYLHNDPREMRGAQTKEERLWLIKHLAGVICVSDYIKTCFLDGLPKIITKRPMYKAF